ncbi:MAG: metal-dependent hydrolase [Saprospiraceae bacterium]|nr:metal-dependent hydrolase [Saprospiraceae bacterium]
MRITYYGHACFLVEMGNSKLLFDPFITYNQKSQEAGVEIDTIKPDYILLSHGHEDHIADVIHIANNSGAKVIAVYEVQQWFEKQGISGHGMNTGGKWNFDFGTVKMVNAIHSSMLPDGSYGGNPVGFVVSNETDGAFYYAGDTALTMDMKLIPLLCPKLDFCIFPIGDNFTMGYEDAVLASNFVECNTIVGCHFDTFPPVEIDHDAAKKCFADAGKNFILPQVGGSYIVGE